MKRTFKMALIASLAVGGSYVLYGSQNKEELSDLALSNVEALTLGTKDCMYQRNSRCYELVVGPVSYTHLDVYKRQVDSTVSVHGIFPHIACVGNLFCQYYNF